MLQALLPQSATPPRSQGRAALAFEGGRMTELYQQGCLKILLPRFGRDAVLVNTSGGLTGGDRLGVKISLGAHEALTVTTQAAERIYRAASDRAELHHSLHLAEGARLDWLPQETILFDASALARRLDVQVAQNAHFLGLESYVFGRAAYGEELDRLYLRDNWRITRGGRLLHAEALRLDHMPKTGATFAACRAAATVVLAAPEAELKQDAARACLPAALFAGVSVPCPGLLVARLMAASSQELRQALIPLLTLLRGAPMPRVWQY